ncbi:hypothetical protein CYMTET_23577 [Cymbomonas tetramitiformis]|uniref:Uncharacterized protein n=1 Tax=Cymbomonas tetramitiformis TaxID=36881 RepID=A0AAE0FXV2_9CHLO|nr:hypothetical protein CYMTET_23577 [Cymbomonas tetramitiformis]
MGTQKAAAEFSRKLKEGVPGNSVTVDCRLGTLKPRHLYWVKEAVIEFAENKPGRKKGWEKTRVPLAFTDTYIARAKQLHAEGKLFPGSTVDSIPEGVEVEPSAEDDDMVSLEHLQEEEQPCVPRRERPSCVGLFENRTGIEEDSGDNEAEEEEDLQFDDMKDGNMCIALADGKDDLAFQVKVGSQNSPWLHLIEVYDRDEDSKRLKWRWWRPLSGGFTSKNTRTMTQASVQDPGFSLDRIPVLSPEFILFDPQEILVA